MNELTAKYKMLYDYHTHTVYSHGAGTIEENIRAAFEKGLKEVAITDHGPGNIKNGFGYNKLPAMREEVNAAMKKYPGIKVLLGVEANIQRKRPYMDVIKKTYSEFDIVLAGYHFAVLQAGSLENMSFYRKYGTDADPKETKPKLLDKNTKMIINCLYFAENNNCHINVLTHPGDKGPFDIEQIAYACSRTKTLMEICGVNPHLTVEEIKDAAKYNVQFIIGSGAHRPEEVGVFEPQLERALEAGLDIKRVVNIQEEK